MANLKKIAFLLSMTLAASLIPHVVGEIRPIDWPFLGLEEIATIPGTITYIANAKDGSDRLFVLERSGRIFIVKDGVVVEQPFLNITNRVDGRVGERGLLGMAFAPDFKESGQFYLNYNRIEDGATVVSRFKISSDANLADAESETRLLTVPPLNQNGYHTGGCIAFGPDGYLYIGDGDGRPPIPGNSLAQNTATLLGKLLRIDVAGNESTYQVPASNPFVGKAGAAPEIWATGLRNPWRFSFDRLTGDLYIADVGEMRMEEVNFQSRASAGGENYGWPFFEGTSRFRSGQADNLTSPVATYFHSFGPRLTAVVGGYVNRESTTNRMFGIYFYADYAVGRIWGLKQQGTNWQTAELSVMTNIYTTFGEDEKGGMYLARAQKIDGDMQIMRLRDTPKCHPPTFSPPPGPKGFSQLELTVNCLTPGATIHYRRDQAVPTLADPAIAPGGKLAILEPGWLSAKAFRDDLEPSEAVSGFYQLSVELAFSPASGPLTNGTPITIKASPADAAIQYSLSGINEAVSWQAYNSPVLLVSNQTLQASATREGWLPSPIIRADYGLLVPVPVVIRIWAGTGESGYEDGTAFSAKFSGPQGICIDAAGNLFVADSANKLIRKITPAGVVSTLGDGSPFVNPIGICVDPEGAIYVADKESSMISKILPDGSTTVYAGTGAKELKDGPRDQAAFSILGHLEIDSAGTIYAGDLGGVRRIGADGLVTTLTGPGFDNRYPDVGVGLGPQGTIIAAVYGPIFQFFGEALEIMVNGGGRSDGPKDWAGVINIGEKLKARDAVGDQAGNVYVTDWSLVREVGVDGIVRTLVPSDANLREPLPPLFGFAAGIVLGNSGEIYVADTDRNLIYRLDVDLDQDSIPDSEEGGTSAFLAGEDDRVRDSDGDGMSNSQEYIAGTDAKDSASLFRLALRRDVDNKWVFGWKGLSGRQYKLQRSNDFQTWRDGSEWLLGNGAEMILPLPTNSEGFFRLIVGMR
jgi:glucose/arabinose dehydrogenase